MEARFVNKGKGGEVQIAARLHFRLPNIYGLIFQSLNPLPTVGTYKVPIHLGIHPVTSFTNILTLLWRNTKLQQ